VPNWKAGDKVLIRPGVELQIIAIEVREPRTTWIVRRN
jgi:hypothetical protein